MTPGRGAVSIVVPVYNSCETLETLVERLEAVLSAEDREHELILVDDGSSDGSGARLIELGRAHSRLRPILLARNFGQHNALLAGIRAARHEVTVTLDDDLQNPPEEIPTLLARVEQGFDVVYGTPQRDEHGLFRRLASRVTKFALQSSMGADTARHASTFRAFRTALRDTFADFSGPFVSIDVLLTWGSTRFDAVAVRHDPRAVGASTYTFRKLLRHAVNMLTGFSTFPLQLASLIGFAFAAFGVAVLAYVLGRFAISGKSVPGFPFLASIIAIFSGAQLFALGIMGEYLSRMHFRSMERPAYAVRFEPGSDAGRP